MLTFKNTNLLFAMLLIVAIVGQVNYGWSAWLYLPLFIVYSLIVFWGCYNVGSNFFIPIVCKANTTEKVIAISFDDGPAIDYTSQILAVLKTYNAPAAFFAIGNRISGNENIVQQWHNDGHVIGNHSYSHHFWFDMYPTHRMKADLTMMDDELENVIGLRPKLFRPPYGVTNPNLAKAIRHGGYTPIGWNVRSMDTVIKDETELLKKVKQGLAPGAIFLFHDTSKATLNMLPKFLKHVNDSGYKIARLDKMLHLQPYA